MSRLVTTDKSVWPRQIAILVLLFCVLVTEVSDNFLGSTVSLISGGRVGWLVAIAFLTVIFSPIQAGYSDYYCRRNSLVLALVATLIYVALANYSQGSRSWFLLGAILFRSVLGNVLPISWAGIADLTHGHQFRFVLALSIYALALGSWGSLLVSEHFGTQKLFYPVAIAIFLALVFFAFGLFKDRADVPDGTVIARKHFITRIKDEIIEIARVCKTKLSSLGLLSFIFSELSFYQIIFRIEIFQHSDCLHWVPLAIGIGYTVGTLSLKFVNASDERTSTLGLIIASVSISILSLLLGFELANAPIAIGIFSCYAFGYAWFTPSLFSLITPEGKPHIQGKIFGIIESSDGISILITYAILWFSKDLACWPIFAISTGLIVISLLFLLAAVRHNGKQAKGATSERRS